MEKFKLGNWNKVEIVAFFLVVVSIIINAILTHDYWVALVSSLCGITYTILAGKGTPICYIAGVLGSTFYCILSYQNTLWGNLILYACYYVPMQILGFFQWNKNLQKGSSIIVKTKLSNKSRLLCILFAIFVMILTSLVLMYFKDAHPILDSITTVGSVFGMYFTVKRVIEQWIAWMIVNSLSLLMWLYVVMHGTKAYSTLAMWAVYLFLAFYFYFDWKKDVN